MDLYGSWTKKVFTSWNVSLKYIWDLPHSTHRYFFEHLTECRHVKILLIRRFLNFLRSILHSSSEVCKLLLHTILRNVQSVTGSNVRNIELEVGERIVVEDISKAVQRVGEQIEFENENLKNEG